MISPWFTLALLVLSHWTEQSVNNWVSFHNGGNTSLENRNLPIQWSPDGGIAWNVQLPGYGQSAPVIWQGQVFVTAVAGNNKEHNFVLSYDMHTGRQLWRRKLAATVKTKNSYMVSRAAPTPVVDGHAVYAMFESGDLHAISHDGRPLWHRTMFDDEEHAFQNGHGYGASPAQTSDLIVVLVDHRGPSFLHAISKKTGEIVWKTTRSPRASWSSPQVVRFAAELQIIVSSAGTVDGYDSRTGRELWSHKKVSGNLIPSATVRGSRVFVGASVARDDSNVTSVPASNCCLQITPGQSSGFKLLWQAKKAVCHYVSPLAHRKHVYYVNRVGALFCLDAQTGQQCYVKRIGGPCWAQPIGADGRLYFFGKNGVTTVVREGPVYEPLAVNHLWDKDSPPTPTRSYEYEPLNESDPRPRHPSQEYIDPIVYGVAATRDAFLVRLGTHLFCIREHCPTDTATE